MAAKPPDFALSPADRAWGDWATSSILEIMREIDRATLEATALSKGIGATVQAQGDQILALAQVVAAIPRAVTSDARSTGFALSGSYVSRVTDTITVPEGKTSVSVLCVAAGAAVDATSGGVTTSYGRIVINGAAGGDNPAAKDAGSSAVNNVINATSAASFAVTPGSTFQVAFQMYGLNGAAYPARPANFAQIATIATFT